MKKMYRPLPKKIKPQHLEAITKLASTGLNKGHISHEVGFGIEYFNRHKEIIQAWDKGRLILAKRVLKSIDDSMDVSYPDRALVVKSMKLFDSSVEVPPVSDVESAKVALGITIQSYLRNEISDTTAEMVRKLCQGFIDAEINTDLASRVKEIERLLLEKQQRVA